jgi:hypothetical protein
VQTASDAVPVLERCREGVLKELAVVGERMERRAHLEQVLARIGDALVRLRAEMPPQQRTR